MSHNDLKPLNFVLMGAGFWARFQLAAWGEVPGARCVAVCDPDGARARALADAMGVPASFEDPAAALALPDLGFVDIVSAVESHEPLVLLAVARGVAAICQKPMAADLDACRRMVAACRDASVPFFVHENFRWQAPVLAVREVVSGGVLGQIFRARIDFISGFSVFDNQPSLKRQPRFILTDVGTHVLDVARFLFGEVDRLHCHTQKIHREIAGEDVATVSMQMRDGSAVSCNLAYAGTPLEDDAFPQPQIFMEGSQGSLRLAPRGEMRVTDASGTRVTQHESAAYAWADPAYALIHASIVPCNESFVRSLRGASTQESGATSGRDNYETLRLVFGCYESAARQTVISLVGPDGFGAPV